MVIDKRPQITGNVYTRNVAGTNVHEYDAHIFHTNNRKVWEYITQFSELNRFTNAPVDNYKEGSSYSRRSINLIAEQRKETVNGKRQILGWLALCRQIPHNDRQLDASTSLWYTIHFIDRCEHFTTHLWGDRKCPVTMPESQLISSSN